MADTNSITFWSPGRGDLQERWPRPVRALQRAARRFLAGLEVGRDDQRRLDRGGDAAALCCRARRRRRQPGDRRRARLCLRPDRRSDQPDRRVQHHVRDASVWRRPHEGGRPREATSTMGRPLGLPDPDRSGDRDRVRRPRRLRLGNKIDAYNSGLITYSDQHSASWTAWAWYTGAAFPSIINDWQGTPSPAGMVVQTALQGYSEPAPGGKRDGGTTAAGGSGGAAGVGGGAAGAGGERCAGRRRCGWRRRSRRRQCRRGRLSSSTERVLRGRRWRCTRSSWLPAAVEATDRTTNAQPNARLSQASQRVSLPAMANSQAAISTTPTSGQVPTPGISVIAAGPRPASATMRNRARSRSASWSHRSRARTSR